jgi:hypothetical protein
MFALTVRCSIKRDRQGPASSNRLVAQATPLHCTRLIRHFEAVPLNQTPTSADNTAATDQGNGGGGKCNPSEWRSVALLTAGQRKFAPARAMVSIQWLVAAPFL